MNSRRLFSIAILSLLTVLPAQGQAPAYLVRDINVDVPKEPYDVWNSLGVGSLFYFSASDGSHGTEIWRSDGTPAGTFLLKDIRPGALPSSPSLFTRSNGLLFFMASTAEGLALWKSDGTPEGTSPVEGAPIPDAVPMIDLGSKLLFFTNSSFGVREIWATDGTPAGTYLVVGAQSFFAYSAPRALAVRNGQALCVVRNDEGLEPWVTDGTAAGTHQVADLNPAGDSIPQYNTAPGNDAVVAPWGGFVFVADDGVHGPEIWKTDGTTAGTSLIKDIAPGSAGSSPFGLTAVNGKVVFAATDPVHGTEIWVTDGTPAGTLLLQDVWPGSSSSDPRELTAVGGQVFFHAADGTHGGELWATDGTPAGTRLVKDLLPGSADAFPPSDSPYSDKQYVFTPLGGRLLFYSPTAGATFWTSDGTAAGTQPVTPSSGSWPLLDLYVTSNHDVVGGRLFFQENFDQSLWVTDGTTAGSYRVLDIRETPGLNVMNGALVGTDVMIADVGGTLFFVANGDDNFRGKLWRSDGTAAGTWQVKDVNEEFSFWCPLDSFRPVNGRLAFHAGVGWQYRGRLALSDGTAAGTGIVPGSSMMGFATRPLGNQLFFFSHPDSAPQGLWKTDGTEAGTVLVAPYDLLGHPGQAAPAGGKIFYTVYNGTSSDLWASDGAGPGENIGPGSDSWNLTDAGGTLFFFGTGNALWKSDGTVAGTVPLRSFYSIRDIIPLPVLPGGFVLFVGHDWEHGPELWRSDGTSAGTVLVKDIFPGIASSQIYDLKAAGSRAFFVADDGVHGQELWTSDGTEPGTHLVKDIVPGAGSSLPYNLTAVGSTLVFTAYDEAHGVEAWRSDGTEAGTWRLADVAPGPLSSSPLGYTLSGNKLFFAANDNTTGFELWAIPKIYVTGTFADVPPNYWSWRFVESLAASGVTGGCGGGSFCPGAYVNRAQMAVFVLTARGTAPPPATGTRFNDVPPGYWAGPWIEELAREGVVGGCAANLYCPNNLLTRAEMAVLLTLARGENPPPATGTRFADVPAGYWAARFIEQLAADGITGGCGGGNYCPGQPITRGEMAVFLATAFHLPLP
jgi:ELWxxDGT repeat protein